VASTLFSVVVGSTGLVSEQGVTLLGLLLTGSTGQHTASPTGLVAGCEGWAGGGSHCDRGSWTGILSMPLEPKLAPGGWRFHGTIW